MSHELFYTSAPRGLRRGSNGYCTVAATRNLPPWLGQQLERLSDYRALADGADAARSPVALSLAPPRRRYARAMPYDCRV